MYLLVSQSTYSRPSQSPGTSFAIVSHLSTGSEPELESQVGLS